MILYSLSFSYMVAVNRYSVPIYRLAGRLFCFLHVHRVEARTVELIGALHTDW